MLKKIFHTIPLTIFATFSQASETSLKSISCWGDYKLARQAPIPKILHDDIQKIGVLVCQMSNNTINPSQDPYTIIFGHDKNQKIWAPYVGQVRPRYPSTAGTAASILSEETGFLLQYPASFFKDLSYIYENKTQLFFLKIEESTSINVTTLNARCNSPQKENYEYLKSNTIDQTTTVSIKELLQVADELRKGNIPSHKASYTLHQSGSQVPIEIDGFYMQMFANRYEAIQKIFNNLLGSNF